MVYGSRFIQYIDRFIRRAKAVGVEHLLVFALDEEAYVLCRAAGTSLCIRGTPSIINKFTLPLILLRAGLDVLWVDFDVFLFRNPLPHLSKYSDQFDLLISDSFSTRCICNGVVFFRSLPAVQHWLLALVQWMYEHPYEHDQKAVSAFLHAGEMVAPEHTLPVGRDFHQVPIPRWGYLDGATQFVTAKHVEDTGWTGDPDDIVLLHFLHGDSDAASGVSPAESRGDEIVYRDLMSIFYGAADGAVYDTPVLPHTVNTTIRDALYESFWESRPRWRPVCTGSSWIETLNLRALSSSL
ncbi:hypothetical protein FOZ60_000305 [Perkinsus olseni]|uniref:Nucleotide-diphospho-sugar transferase domain-containing protein n=1 Tax=Perkinsus olseni TaxID=32597 RepID=A0A7J6P2D5_PEROL|nr:hypothetical protein FOZ60_000305 [Perkinsus olseni]